MIESVESLIPHLGWLAHPPGDEVARFLAEGWIEYREQAFCWMYLREGDTVIDAGAHFGLYAVLAARLIGATGAVLAVEANPAMEPFLAANLARYGEGRGQMIIGALASRPGEANIFVGGGGRAAYSSSIPETPGAEPSKAPAVILDDLCAERAITRVALAKLDVEGDEIEVLRGALHSISGGVLPLWMIEFAEANMQRRGSSTRVLFDEISSLGYTVCRFDELRCRLVPVEWTGPVWYENYFAAASIEQVNQRLSECPPENMRVARDILRRGAAAMALHEAARRAERRLEGAETRLEAAGNRVAVLEERLQEANRQASESVRRMALEKDEVEQRLAAEKIEAAQRLEAARKAADEADRRAQEINAHLEESWRRIGEANWRADEAVNRSETAAERGEAAYRRLEVADRRTANARYEAGLLKTRLRELLSHPRLAKGPKPEWAEAFLRSGEGLTVPSCESDNRDPMQRALYHLSGKNFRPRAILDVGAG
ncbi:MAG TPA: FkbM family methyltransferase, partial [Bryobacteraceae bacterium]|nr:FkbM family methyltransferase [Bryobacteraceae bacterium]